MAVDSMMLNPMISPYADMVKDVDARGLTGEDVDALKKAYERLVSLGQEHDDVTAFMGQVMQENLYTELSDNYSKALSAEAAVDKDDAASNYDDAKLLKQSVDALRMAIEEIKKGKEAALEESRRDPKANLKAESEFASRFAKKQGIDMQGIDAKGIEKAQSKHIDEELAEKPNAYNSEAEVEALDMSQEIIPPIEDLIALGEEDGMTLPKFLRIQVEKGLDKAMEGTGATRKGMEYLLGWAEASATSPYHIDHTKEDLAVFDDLASKHKFGVPETQELKWALNDVDYKYELDKIKWYDITNRWEDLLYDLSYWSLAHCSFAPWVDPWKQMAESQKPPAILKAKDITPGIFKEKERLLEKYFGIKFMDIFDHPTFKWAVEKNHISYSDEYVEFLKTKVYPACIPCQHLPDEIIKEKEKLVQEKREMNPHYYYPIDRVQIYYDLKFGEGRYVSKFGSYDKMECNAEPWPNSKL